MNEVQFISHFEGLNLDQNIIKYEKKIKNGMAELINMTNQIKIENFLSGDLSDLLIIDYIDVINSVKRTPTKIHNHFTGMNSGIILDWILIIMKNPEAFARIVVKFFRSDSKNLSYFSAITFPCLFHHFFTEDFQKLSYQFLISMLESGDIGTFWYFCLSFIESSSNFSIVLWSNFLNFNENQNIFFNSSHFPQQNYNQKHSNSQPKIQKSQIFFRFLKCLKIASSSLSIYQQQIVKKFYDANAPTCSFFLCKYFIERSFFWFRGNEPDQENQASEKRNPSASSSDKSGQNPFFSAESSSHQNGSNSTYNEENYQNKIFNRKNANYVRNLNEEIIKILEYASLNPKSPQFTAIVNVLTSSGLSRFVPNLVSSHTFFILSQRDCYLIQEIIKKNAQDKKSENKDQHENESSNQKDNNQNTNEIKFVNVFPLNKDSFTNFTPMSIEIPLANFIKLYNDKKSFNPNREDFSIFQIKNDKFDKLMDLIIFDHFIENEYSKRSYEQIRSHFCFASKLLQKNQFIKRKMIDFNGFYGYFQSHNCNIKRHTHSNQSVFNESKPKKGITSYKSYYSHKTDNIFDLPKLSTFSPEPAAPKCPLSAVAKNVSESTNSYESAQEKKSIRKRVVFNQNSEDDNFNSFKLDQVPYKNEKIRRKSLNIRRSFSDLNPNQKRDFGYNNDEYVVKVEVSQTRKKKAIFNQIEDPIQTNQNENENNSSAPSSHNNNNNNNDIQINQNENMNDIKNENDNETGRDDSSELDENKKSSRKKSKKQERKRKKQQKKEKKLIKKEKSKEEKKQIEQNKEEDKEEKKEEKILIKENERKEKKEKKKLLKQKREEEKRKKINMKKEKRREKMRKNQEKKLRKNSEISLPGDFENDNDDDSDSDSDKSQNESNIKSDSNYNSTDFSENLSLDLNDQKTPRNGYSSESDNDNDNDDNDKDIKKADDAKVENKAAKDTNPKNLELKKYKKPKKKKKSKIRSQSDIYTYFNSSILLSSSNTKEIRPILHNLIPQIENNESKFILYCIKLNDFEFKSKKVDQITSQYVLLFNSQRLRKIKKYLTIHSNWFRAAKFLASEIDFMSDFNIGTSLIIFCQLCKYFSQLSSYSQAQLNEAHPSSYSSSNIENNTKSKNKNSIIINQDLLQSCTTVEEESENSSESIASVYRSTLNNDYDNSVYTDTDTSLDIYSYKNDVDYDSESTNSNEYSDSNSNSGFYTNKLEFSSYLIKDSSGNQVPIYPPALINKDVVNFLRFALMLSHTDCFIRYFTWITRVLVVFPQIKAIICQVYGFDVSHLEVAFKTLLSKIDKPLLLEIGKEVFKKSEKDDN